MIGQGTGREAEGGQVGLQGGAGQIAHQVAGRAEAVRVDGLPGRPAGQEAAQEEGVIILIPANGARVVGGVQQGHAPGGGGQVGGAGAVQRAPAFVHGEAGQHGAQVVAVGARRAGPGEGGFRGVVVAARRVGERAGRAVRLKAVEEHGAGAIVGALGDAVGQAAGEDQAVDLVAEPGGGQVIQHRLDHLVGEGGQGGGIVGGGADVHEVALGQAAQVLVVLAQLLGLRAVVVHDDQGVVRTAPRPGRAREEAEGGQPTGNRALHAHTIPAKGQPKRGFSARRRGGVPYSSSSTMACAVRMRINITVA